jgi:hypothetical protein
MVDRRKAPSGYYAIVIVIIQIHVCTLRVLICAFVNGNVWHSYSYHCQGFR